MNKNVIIGVLIVALLALGGYYLMKDKTPEDVVVENTGENTETPAEEENNTPPVVAPSPSAPTVQTNPNYSASSSTAVLNGQVKPNGALTTYWFDYGETTALGARTTSQQIGSGFSSMSTPAFITGLKADTVYYFRLSANNRFATVNGATFTFKTNSNPPPVGVAPAAQTSSAGDVSRMSANLRGQVNPNGSETSYWFEYGKDINFGNVTALQTIAGGNSSVSVAAAVSSLDPLTKYYFRLNAQNQYGTVNGLILSFTTKGPAVPSAPLVNTNQASNIQKTGATLNGSINPNGAETTYWFEYSEDSLLGNIIGSGTSPQTLSAGTSSVSVKANVSGLQEDTKYFYRLVARNSSGTTQGSVVAFTTKK